MQHKAAINRARPGPAQARTRHAASGHLAALRASRRALTWRPRAAQEAAKQRALRVLRQKKMCAPRGVRAAARCV